MNVGEKRQWTASELYPRIIEAAERWRYRCRGLPLLLKLIDAVERLLLKLASLLIDLQRARYPTRYDRIRRG